MATRTDEILSAVDELLRVHDAWEADDTAPVQPSEALEQAIEHAIHVADSGDVPAQCRELCLAMSRLNLEWHDYSKGTKRTRDFRPVGSFWGAFRNVVTCREGAVPYIPKQPEPVWMLIEQKVPYQQIACYIWGHGGKGPFVTATGQPDIEKIHDEGKNPGKHTTGWVHPAQAAMAAGRKAEMSRRINAITSRERRDTPAVEKATIEEMLRERQYPDVIAKVKGVSVDDVLKAAKKLNIVPNERPNLASMRAPHEPEIFGADESPSLSASSAAASADESDGDYDKSNDGVSINEQIVALNDGTRGKPEIVAEMKKRGVTVTFKQIADAVRFKKNEVSSTAG